MQVLFHFLMSFCELRHKINSGTWKTLRCLLCCQQTQFPYLIIFIANDVQSSAEGVSTKHTCRKFKIVLKNPCLQKGKSVD